MTLTGKNYLGRELSSEGKLTFQATDPSTGQELPGVFFDATEEEVKWAGEKAARAFQEYRNFSGAKRAEFLRQVADEILALGDDLIDRCVSETGLPAGRITGERGRTMNQLKLFADVIEEGSWVDARIDTAIPDREPIPKPDLRYMHKAIGPVGVFGASNFPLAFSVAGGDTASAFAAGCPVVTKAHPAHPGTCELIASAIVMAAEKLGLPEGIFSMVHGRSVDVGLALVRHPQIKAVGFTGSYGGGKALFDEAVRRPEPIPFYAEMSSINPVFILPKAMKERRQQISEGLSASVALGVGQFCTNPGLVITSPGSDGDALANLTAEISNDVASATMLSEGIKINYDDKLSFVSSQEGVEVIGKGKDEAGENTGQAHVLKTSARNFISNKTLETEVFGPSTLMVTTDDRNELLEIANGLEGHLTATLHGTDDELDDYADLLNILEQKVGRLIINGYPTGVEVCHSMVHGGPFPATTDSRSTSVGTAAIYRFARPISYQNFPQSLLPDELKDNNPLSIWRMIDGKRGNK